MLDIKLFFKENLQFLLLIVGWILLGRIAAPLGIVAVLGSIILLKRQGLELEIFLGFLLILILSDSRSYLLDFAKTVKNFYIVILAGWLFFDSKQFKPYSKLHIPFIPFFILATILLIRSETVFTSFQKTLSYFLLLLVVPNYILTLVKKSGIEVYKKIVFFLSLLLFVGLILRFVNPWFVMLEGRYTGIFGNPNGLGIFCVLFFFLFSVIRNLYDELFTKQENIIIYGLVGISVILCGSRTAVIAIAIFLVSSYLYKKSPILVIMFALFITLISEFITQNIVQIIIILGLEEFFRIETLEDGSGRTIVWDFAWKHINKNFYFGKGFSHTEYLYKINYTYLSRLGHQGNAHNSYLTFWLDNGLIGLGLYFIGVIRVILESIKNSKLALPVLAAVLFAINFESWLTASLNPFTIIFWMIVSVMYFYRDINDHLTLSDTNTKLEN